MARRKSKSKSSSRTPVGRDAYAVASPVHRLPRPAVLRLPVQVLPLIEDRRRFDPTISVSRPKSIRQDQARLTLRASRAPVKQTKTPLSFAVPEKVALCRRREIRREVLHAKRVAGKRGLRPPRRNLWSSISCKR